ncbi:Tetratricopeptide repeat-containing protein [Arthrobacter sp. P2b]|nr:Tetratricopeptide repeat-containing protein [Arthrobacter sp. P2b]
MIIDGGPLVGKKRMALEWADSLGPEWERGWLKDHKGSEAVERIAGYGKDTVVVVDGASSHFADLVLDVDRHKTPPQIRVLMTVRDVQGLRIADRYAAAVIKDVKPLHLKPTGDTGDRERWFEELCRHYADRMGVPVPSHPPGFIRELGVVPIGVLHAAAFAAARAGTVPLRSREVEEIMYELWQEELESWRDMPGVPSSGREGVGDAQLERLGHAVVALSLLKPANPEIAVKVLERIPTLSGTDAGTQRDIIAWATRMFRPPGDTAGGPSVPEFSPGIIAVAAFLHTAGNDSNFGHKLLSFLTDVEAFAVLRRLVEAAPLLPSAGAWAGVVIGSNFTRLTNAVEITLATSPANGALDRELARCASGCDLDEERTLLLLELIPPGLLPTMKVALAELRVKQLRDRVQENAGKYEQDLARALCTLSTRLGGVGGRSAEALDATQEGVAMFRRLATENPGLYEPDLAVALNNLAVDLGKFGGRDADAVGAVQESVTLYRRLAANYPVQHEPDLARALNTLAERLGDTGGHSNDALRAAQESVIIYRRLAAENPTQYESDLALALNNLATRLGNAGGRGAEAVNAAQEAVTIYRRLTADNPALHEPALASALDTLSVQLGEAEGRGAKAVDVAQESVDIYRLLAAQNPALYEPKLARALNNLAVSLGDTGGRGAQALNAAQESVTIYRRLAAANPALHEPDLAAGLNNLAIRLAAAGAHRAQALKATKESISIHRRLAADNPAPYEPALAAALHNLAIDLGEAGGHGAQAVEAAQESVTIYRRLSSGNPALYQPRLALALNALAANLDRAGMQTEASVAWRELVHVYEGLARQDPQYKAALARVQHSR